MKISLLILEGSDKLSISSGGMVFYVYVNGSALTLN